LKLKEIKNFIEDYYNISVMNIRLLDSHFGTDIYKVDADKSGYIVKAMPPGMVLFEKEGLITEYLSENGVKTARLVKNNREEYVSKAFDVQLTVQEFIKGYAFAVNTAPDWLMNKSAEMLGKINAVLSSFPDFSVRFGKEFFSKETAARKKLHLEHGLIEAEEELRPFYTEQIRYFERILKFEIDTNRLTYANSHGDYHIGQLIVSNKDVTVIDWASACRLPVCLEVATSYVFASPLCCDGNIDEDDLATYISTYTRYFPLSEYDIKMMPYVLYFWHSMCNYSPDELLNIPESYISIASLIQKMLTWLYDNADKLSKAVYKKVK
jgi:Ser/Thr protein kinase RdoA (MazF antagonist)